MNGTNPTTRRRPHAPPPTAFNTYNERAYAPRPPSSSRSYSPMRAEVKRLGSNNNDDDDGGQGKSRRSHSSMRLKLRRFCTRRRVLDVILVVGGVAKLASMVYDRHGPLHADNHVVNMARQQHSHDHGASSLSHWQEHIQSSPSLTTSTSHQSWMDQWRENKYSLLPFHTPILYRFNEDDNHSDKYRGMFRSKHLSDVKSQALEDQGYAIVDDIIYHADDNRGRTNWALHDSNCVPQILHPQNEDASRDHLLLMNNSPSSIGFSNHEPKHEQQFYIDDGGDWDAYYAFDDDSIRSAKGTGLHEKVPTEEIQNQQCMRPEWYSIYYPTCNEIHASISGEQWMLGEESLARNWDFLGQNSFEDVPRSKYLGSGYYRNAFLLQRPFVQTQSLQSSSKLHNNNNNVKASVEFDEVVFKSMKQLDDKTTTDITDDDEVLADGWAYDPTDKYSYTELMEDMRKDAMVMELLTSSPRSANIYSYCGLSSVIEFAPIDIEDYIMPSKGRHPKLIRRHADPEDHGLINEYPVNDHIPPHEKLEIALEMAKCLAEMHGYAHGPIAHVDVQAGQFFRGRDGLIKLVDFNRAEALLYDIKQDKYCKFVNGPPAEGMFRAPEENIDAPLTEKIDIFSLGNVLYSVLTGIMVHVSRSSNEAHKRIVDGITEPIADLYYEEPSTAALAEVIELCWTYDAEERPTIFEIVQLLEKAVKASRLQDSRRGKLR